MTKTESHAVKRQFPGDANGEEARFFASLSKSAPLSETVKAVEFRFGVDSDNDPAVWIVIRADPDDNPSKSKIAELSRVGEALRAAVLNSQFNRWPYVKIEVD